jgi:hypothetical protein
MEERQYLVKRVPRIGEEKRQNLLKKECERALQGDALREPSRQSCLYKCLACKGTPCFLSYMRLYDTALENLKEKCENVPVQAGD